MSRISVQAPCSGWLLPLAEVDDPVFSTGMAGAGMAIEPLEQAIFAPAAGSVVLMGPACHALTLRIADGVDLLIHIGIDTVNLHGAGFERCVQDGQTVAAGDCLIRFDLDLIARRARSTATPIVLVSGGRIVSLPAAQRVSRGQPLFEVEWSDTGQSATQSSPAGSAEQVRQWFRIPFEHGLHARPAAQLVAALKPCAAEVRLSHRHRDANGRSAIALMSLGLVCQDEVEMLATGPDAGKAMAAWSELLVPISGTDGSAAAHVAAPALTPLAALPPCLTGIPAVKGLALGEAVCLHEPELELMAQSRGLVVERTMLRDAIQQVAAAQQTLLQQASPVVRAVLEAHAVLLGDPELAERAEQELLAGQSAALAWRAAIRHQITVLSASRQTLHAERAADLLDLERQVLRACAGLPPMPESRLPESAVLLADELLPSQFAQLDASRIAAIAMARGGATSHVALLAAAKGIPTLIGLGPDVLRIDEGCPLIVDANQGRLWIAPEAAHREQVQAQQHAQAIRDAEALAQARRPACLRDGLAVSVLANLGKSSEAAEAVARGAEGCGLLRSEFLFLDRRAAPDQAEQEREYRRIIESLNGGVLTLRTLDVGGDKPLPYLPIRAEENPALGVRGLRFSLREPELLKTQFRAALAAARFGPLRVMLPMVNDLFEFRAARALFEQCRQELGAPDRVPLGVMIETPAAALLADQLATEAAFLSIGSNDLSQYVLAMDRGHPELATHLDALHPAVLRMIAQVAKAGRAAGRSVSVCGGLASDVDAVPILIGLGVSELSAVPTQIPALKQLIRQLDRQQCEQLAQRALTQNDARAVRAVVANVLKGVQS